VGYSNVEKAANSDRRIAICNRGNIFWCAKFNCSSKDQRGNILL